MKRFPRRLLFTLLLVLAYVLWHPAPTRRELTIRPAWAIDLTAEVARDRPGDVGRGAPDALIPVAAEGVYAYLSADGRIVHLVVSAGGTRLGEWTLDGRLRWRMDLPAPIASVAGAAGRTGLGLLAGGALLVEPDGSLVALQRSAAVTEPVVHAVGLSEEPARFAVVTAAADPVASGDDDLRVSVTLYDVDEGRGLPVVRRMVPHVSDGAPFVGLVDDGQVLVYSARAGAVNALVSLDVDSGDDTSIPVRHAPLDLRELPGLGLRVALSTSSRRDPARGFARPSELTVFSREGLVPVRASWAADVTSLDHRDELFVVRVDERFLAFALEVE